MNLLEKRSHPPEPCPVLSCRVLTLCSRACCLERGWLTHRYVKSSSFPVRLGRMPSGSLCPCPVQIDAFQHMQHFVQTMQQQAQHAIAPEDQQHKQELHKLMAR